MLSLARSVLCAVLAFSPILHPSFCPKPANIHLQPQTVYTPLDHSEHTKWAWKDCASASRALIFSALILI